MEWNGKFYFGWPYPPWRGIVYAVDPAAVDFPAVVVLPSGVQLRLAKSADGEVEISEASGGHGAAALRFKAEHVFDTNSEGEATFGGSWDPLIPFMEAAAAVNALYSVKISKELYDSLGANNEAEFEVLKGRFSPNAAPHLFLLDYGDYYCVQVCRSGRCP